MERDKEIERSNGEIHRKRQELASGPVLMHGNKGTPHSLSSLSLSLSLTQLELSNAHVETKAPTRSCLLSLSVGIILCSCGNKGTLSHSEVVFDNKEFLKVGVEHPTFMFDNTPLKL
ncbi:hypothetical protein AMTRI_Chr08g167480 [Amborella trichopoda]